MYQLHGRIGRLRYLAYVFGIFVVINFSLLLLSIPLGAISAGTSLFLVALSLPLNIVSIIIFSRRRLNDLGHSGWFTLLTFIPVVNFVFGLYLFFARGDEASNEYGLPPNTTPILVKICGLMIPIVLLWAYWQPLHLLLTNNIK
jgi:uncharacterized membrane protein YhaH (DUF805 family)